MKANLLAGRAAWEEVLEEAKSEVVVAKQAGLCWQVEEGTWIVAA